MNIITKLSARTIPSMEKRNSESPAKKRE